MSNIEGVCRFCGCTEKHGCVLSTSCYGAEVCHWIAPGVCSNPECVEKAYAETTIDELLDLVERLEAA